MAVAVSSNAHLEMELQRARALQHDLIKSYVRMPDLQQRRIVEFAHAVGVPAASRTAWPCTAIQRPAPSGRAMVIGIARSTAQ